MASRFIAQIGTANAQKPDTAPLEVVIIGAKGDLQVQRQGKNLNIIRITLPD